jgi:hypothetical protein
LQRFFHLIEIVTICLVAGSCFAQSNQGPVSVCGLQSRVSEGSHISLTVSGLYQGGSGDSGPAMGTLSDKACPGETAWIEITLNSPNNRKKLKNILNKSHFAYVVFEGELFGPPLPDPKLPENIRENSYPGWGHLGAFRTKIVVHSIRYVADVREAKPRV